MAEDFKGVNYYLNTPAVVAHDNRLKPNAKLFFGEIYSLANVYGDVYISNAALAKRYELTVDAASRLISQLVKYGYITIELHYKEGTKQVVKRSIKVNPLPDK
ncbi:helix-turn-helix domain-containing protein [Weissella confusa]|uniref:helix-turn-helix domain-containing protein n=1 Tax=Weissella confusa TaxID=1583 RepID=UPI000989A16C|nr:helix-turn-helix domain-containing protein [Weissella confusa]MBJ7654370.1 helix-turn-helix domain-containing protein [Weissella confusa]TGE42283.1 helix-turn-helix domain-containing protein [Weissella confusa]SJX67270.1 phage protein [Weissella confusa]